MMSREAVNKQIDDHLARWRKKMTSPSATNTDLANDAIYGVYQLVKKRAPEAILWLDSPYQMAVLPPLVVTVLDSAEWSELTASLKTLTPGCMQWEQRFSEGWMRLRETKVDALGAQIMKHARLRAVPDAVRNAALTQLGVIMRQLAYEGTVTSVDHLYTGKKKKVYRKNVLYTPLDLDFTKALIETHNRIEQAAGLKITDGNLLSFYTAMGPFLGVWDKRIMTHLLPKSEILLGRPVQLSSLKREQVLDIKRKCNTLDTLSLTFMTWFMNCVVLPRRDTVQRERIPNEQATREPVEHPELMEQFADWSNTFVNAYTTVSGAIAQSREQTREANANPNFANLFTTWLPYSAAWLPFALAVRYLDASILKELEPEIEAWSYMSHAALGYAFTETICFACRKPLEFLVTDNDRPHNESGPAASWLDGFKIYAWRGVMLDSDIIENKAGITVNRINDAENAEIRRVLIEIYGQARYLLDAGAQKIHEDECGVLYRLPVPGDEALTMVKVRNSTPEPDGTYKDYFLRVPPNMERAKQAVAWTFGLEEHQYKPKRQT